MAECSLARCSHERRVFRKEFQRWSRDLLLVVGLERVAEALMGKKKWKRFVEPMKVLEKDAKVEDWEPDEVCYFCNSKTLPPYDPAGGFLPEDFPCNPYVKMDTDEQSTSSDQGNGSASSNVLLPGVDPSALKSGSPALSDDQPLDLSLHSHKHHPHEPNIVEDMVVNNGEPLIKVPFLPNKSGTASSSSVPSIKRRTDLNCKRSYTEEELQAALRDIQSGKLGTRRAAVIYGIPRSTLRNKVYKLSMERRMGKTKAPVNEVKKEAINGIKTIQGDISSSSGNLPSASESLRQLLKSTITQKTQGKTDNEPSDKAPSTTTATVNPTVPEQAGLFYNQDALNTFQYLSSMDYTQALAPLFAQFLSSIHHLALAQRNDGSIQQPTASSNMKLPVLPDLIKHLAEERLLKECSRHRDAETPSQEVAENPSSTDSQDNVILKIPSYKPATANSAPSTPSTIPTPSSLPDSGTKGITVSLKELIAKSISQRVNSSTSATNISTSSLTNTNSNCSISSNSSSSSEKQTADTEPTKQSNGMSSPQKDLVSGKSEQSPVSPNTTSSNSEKRTRPKRGRYRNYDRNNLLQAVRAVQRGEMSVHRAGTYFGVPHSTLEYKVKERHLLRPKKRGSGSSANSSVPSQVGLSLGKNNQFSVSNSIMNSLLLKDVKAESSPHSSGEMTNGVKTPPEDGRPSFLSSNSSALPFWQAMPFFPMDFSDLSSSNFFASQIMRKLQANAQGQEDSDKASDEKKPELGILETLIKSTLDKSVPSEVKPITTTSTTLLNEISSTPVVPSEVIVKQEKEEDMEQAINN